MSDTEILKQASLYFKSNFPGLTPEAVIAFLVAASQEGLTVGQIAQMTGSTEPDTYHHMKLLAGGGAGLVGFVNGGDGSNVVQLTGSGEVVRDSILADLSNIPME